jgi:hypothetical protein
MDDLSKLSLRRQKMAIRYPIDQFEFVNELLNRQDKALAELDLLDAKVDETIKELMGTREPQVNPTDPNFQTF